MTAPLTLMMPWPKSGELSQNARGSWRKLHGRRAEYKRLCMNACLAQKIKKVDAVEVRVRITFHPPDRQPRNDDNMISAFKAGRDGVAQMIGLADEYWDVSYHFGEPVKHGVVVLEIAALGAGGPRLATAAERGG